MGNKHPSTAADVIGEYVADQVHVIQEREPQVRVDHPDSVHKMRVATRRLRSTLRTFQDVLDTQRTDPLREEIKWLGEMLGGPRDAEVLKDRLGESLDELPPEAILGPVRERLTNELDARHAQAHAELLEALDSRRYRDLSDALHDLVDHPPFLPEANHAPRKTLAPLMKAATQRVTRRWDAAQCAPEMQRAALAHEARKKAKAARYAWEAVADVFPGGSDSAEAWEAVTEVLGTAQDSVVARERLTELAHVAEKSGEQTFTYGVLYARELTLQGDAHESADPAIVAAVKASQTATGR